MPRARVGAEIDRRRCARCRRWSRPRRTPGSVSAADRVDRDDAAHAPWASARRACAAGAGNEMSAAKRPRPVTSGRSSRRVGPERPTNIGRRGHVRARISRGRRAHRLDDVLIAGAAAQIGRQHVEQVLVADVRLALQHAGRQHQEARRAEAALQAVMVHEGLLQRMQRRRRWRAPRRCGSACRRPAPRTSGRSAPARRRR